MLSAGALRYLQGHGARRLAQGEWGLLLEAADAPLDVGLRVSRGLLRAQAPAGRWAPGAEAALLHRNRSLELVRYATTRAGEVWVVGDVPVGAADEAGLDRLLGGLVEAVDWARRMP